MRQTTGFPPHCGALLLHQGQDQAHVQEYCVARFGPLLPLEAKKAKSTMWDIKERAPGETAHGPFGQWFLHHLKSLQSRFPGLGLYYIY